MGPGGLFRALRSIPVIVELAEEVKKYAAPGALILNYVNPMAMVCWALGTTGVNFVGLCHGVQTTLDLISGYVGVPKDQIDFLCAGINHMAWFLEIKKDGEDLYPLFKERFEQPGYYVNEKVRGEAMRQFGYFMTASPGPLSEYLPWFRASERALATYCDEPAFGGESGAYYNWCAHVAGKYENELALENEPLALPKRSIEYGSYIVEAMETGKVFKLNGNVRNDGIISNLPDACCAEGPIYVDALGLHPVRVGALPPQCAALNMTNINVQGLGVKAALTSDTELIVAAAALDPLTSTRCTLNEIREMCAEMLEAQRQWLPAFAGKSIKKTPAISIPKDVKRADVPVDPALAIIARFGELGK
jgi:alpha-galactosidase